MSALPYPFLRETFLKALEESGSACSESGWQPIHLTLDDGDTGCFMPLYLKDHSMGEYVFDHAWANAYHQNGLEYYPKLVTAVPFTPSTGSRLRSNNPISQQHCRQIIDEVISIAEDTDASSWHILFPEDNDLKLFDDPRLLKRTGVQYHWLNKDYQCFDDYLGAMTSRKRKMIRKERDEILKQNIEVEVLLGAAISAEIWALFYQLYERTYAKRNGTRGYLTQAFFESIATGMPEQIAMSVATQDGKPIACALYLFDSDSLYGRYWGSLDFPSTDRRENHCQTNRARMLLACHLVLRLTWQFARAFQWQYFQKMPESSTHVSHCVWHKFVRKVGKITPKFQR